MTDLVTSANHPRGYYPAAGWYLRNWRAAQAALAERGTVTIAWHQDSFPQTMDQAAFTAWIRNALERRITEKGGTTVHGHKAGGIYQIMQERDCRAVREHVTRRLRVYQFETAEVRRRFAHYLSARGED